MDNKVIYKWVEEIEQRCRFADLALKEIRDSLNDQVPERVFLHVHSYLDQVAVLNGMLWPKRQASLPRGDELRKALGVNDSSALNIRAFRGQIGAEDESYEDWLNGLPEPNYVDFNLMPASTMTGFSSDTFHRDLDPESFKFTYRAGVCDLKSVHAEVRALQSAITRWKRENSPW